MLSSAELAGLLAGGGVDDTSAHGLFTCSHLGCMVFLSDGDHWVGVGAL